MIISSSTTPCRKPYTSHARAMPWMPAMSVAQSPNAPPSPSGSAQRPGAPGAVPAPGPKRAASAAVSLAVTAAFFGRNGRAAAAVTAS